MRGRRSVLQEVGPIALDFLVHDHGFEGPEFGSPSVGQGERLTFRRPDLTVTVETWSWKNESGFDTNLTLTPVEGKSVSAALHSIYEVCGLGTASDVPVGNSGGGAIVKTCG